MFLNRIVADKLKELEQREKIVPLRELRTSIKGKPLPLDLKAVLDEDGIGLIAEVKKASPSKGVLCSDLNSGKVASTYAECGAVAISVLTESRYFQGSPKDFKAIRQSLPNVPLLRKDFIMKPYQVVESRAWGADALLLIVSILHDTELKELLSLSHSLGMQCLVEVHNENELKRALGHEVKIIGINNRNLHNMSVDIHVTGQLRPLIPPDRIVVSESGIKGRGDIEMLRKWGVDAVLIGEALVTADDIAATIRELFR